MAADSQRSVALVGATGFIGWHLSERLRDRGWFVRAIVRPESHGRVPAGVDVARTTLGEAELLRAVDGCEAVINLAGRTSAPSQAAFDAVNVELAAVVARAAVRAGSRLVHVSSQAAAGPGRAGRPRTEADPPEPCSPYGRSKLGGRCIQPGADAGNPIRR
jgi:nucleoside-diphosphate-sugar epimerase